MKNIRDFLEMLQEEAEDTEVSAESPSEYAASDKNSKEESPAEEKNRKVYIDTNEKYKSKISGTNYVYIKYQDLASKLSEMTSRSFTKQQAKEVFQVIKEMIGV